MLKILNNIFDQDKKYLKKYREEAKEVLILEDVISKLTDEELKNKTQEFKEKLKTGALLEEIKIEAFAVAREASFRVLKMKPFEVQVMGALALFDGNISEMKTGEGKTLTSVMPAYTYALEGRGVHIVTVNEYLATRDSQEMGQIHNFLDITVGLSLNSNGFNEKKEAYESDITYVTNSEVGFDYLRDNMALYESQRVIRELNYAIVDEIDSILIDEARTPLIISGQEKKVLEMYSQVNTVARSLKDDKDFKISLKDKVANLTNNGIDRVEQILGIENLFDLKNSNIAHALNQALKANYCMEKDVDYVVSEDKVVIVDQFTGRTMEGRVFSDGLHQALEAKEGVTTQKETKTLATITYQNYFRMYNKLSGMTGTAKTEEEEFQKIYDMDVVPIPTNQDIIRIDRNDLIFFDKKSKYNHMLELIKERNKIGQPMLIGTVAIETSEEISKLLTKNKITHIVLNAKNHFQEADIIKNAGNLGAVTIATNMAGRGTDIKISKEVKELEEFESEVFNSEVIKPNGLLVIGTERHESRRIDNQLRGRSGRQGDAGESVFYVSYEDDLARRFLSETMAKRLTKINNDGEAISGRMWTKQIASLQKKVESINFDQRQNVLKYDDVLREQRELMYGQRDAILFSDSSIEIARELINNYVEATVNSYLISDETEELQDWVNRNIAIELFEINFDEDVLKQINTNIETNFTSKIEQHGEIIIDEFSKTVMIKIIDDAWVRHIDEMQTLRESIGLRGYGQINPLQEYQKEGREKFDVLMVSIEQDVVKALLKSRIQSESERLAILNKMEIDHDKATSGHANDKTTVVKGKKIGRNDICSCGSGLKYKNCCGK